MADTIAIELLTKSTLKGNLPFWQQYDLFRIIYDEKALNGKDVAILHVDIAIDTSTANTATESTAPTNTVLNFTTPQQVYIRSDAAGDTSKSITVIGQKSDGVFGSYTLTSDASDGTTAVDVGTWYFMSYPIADDTWAGNVIIDDDGASTTVFWTLALGASGTDGILVVPDGYRGSLMAAIATLTAAPASAAHVIGLDIADSWVDLLTTNKSASQPLEYRYVEAAQTRVGLKHFYRTAVTTTTIDLFMLVWEA